MSHQTRTPDPLYTLCELNLVFLWEWAMELKWEGSVKAAGQAVAMLARMILQTYDFI